MKYRYSVEYIAKERVPFVSDFTLSVNNNGQQVQKLDVVSAVLVSSEPLSQESLDTVSNVFIVKELPCQKE